MGKLTEFLMKAPPLPAGMGFCMPMMKGWVPRRLQPWIYVLTALCFQFSGGMYLGALDEIRGTTNFMIEDVMFLLYATLAGMAMWFPMLFRMKFRFTNQQLLCTSAIVMGICNVITMHSQSMPVLGVTCFIAGIAKIQGTFECMSNIQLWITPKRDFAVFFPRAPHHTSYSHRRRWMACSLDGASFYLADDARLYRRHHVVRAAVTDSAVSSVLSYA